MDIICQAIEFGSPEHQQEIALRTKILRIPLGLSFSPEELQEESSDLHLGAFKGEQLVGCLLLRPYSQHIVKMRQVAVDDSVQGQGVGRMLVEFSETVARESGFGEIILHARDVAVPFYQKLKYKAFGESFTEVGILHWKMQKILKR